MRSGNRRERRQRQTGTAAGSGRTRVPRCRGAARRAGPRPGRPRRPGRRRLCAAARHRPPFQLPQIPLWLSGPVGWAVAVTYLAGGWTALGASPGSRLMGLRVTDRAGRRLRLPRALARAALCVSFPLGLLWIPLSKRRVALQDLVVRSEVSYDLR
ncbi:RDD family protein [Streptomyces sp. Q6]|uniref:RDD family protein n=1 Tax=Streptomyces citrinus TaxID=3118173 RepID=A0ACD5APA7_9ACTN